MSNRYIKRLFRFSEKNKRRDVFFERIYRKALAERKYYYQRQKVINRYIVDFVFPKRNLIVEIDEEHHLIPEVAEYDAKREKNLKKWGFNVVRFTDFEILNELEDCVNCVDDFDESKEIHDDFNRRVNFLNKSRDKYKIKKKRPKFSCAVRYSKR